MFKHTIHSDVATIYEPDRVLHDYIKFEIKPALHKINTIIISYEGTDSASVSVAGTGLFGKSKTLSLGTISGCAGIKNDYNNEDAVVSIIKMALRHWLKREHYKDLCKTAILIGSICLVDLIFGCISLADEVTQLMCITTPANLLCLGLQVWSFFDSYKHLKKLGASNTSLSRD